MDESVKIVDLVDSLGILWNQIKNEPIEISGIALRINAESSVVPKLQ